MNKNLPIYNSLESIVNAVAENDVIIVKAETGSGKSTQIPQALYEAGYEVVVTQPRRVAARSVASRVAEEMGVKLGDVVGYKTGFEKNLSRKTKITFCTDGIELAVSLNRNIGVKRVLCIDEVHEYNLNIEALLAWCKRQISRGFASKVVIMSATIDTSKLQRYFFNCPVFSIPGSLYPVKMNEIQEYEIFDVLKRHVERNENVLVFESGKKEIEEFIAKYSSIDAEFLPLHGELPAEEQDSCFRSYNKSKIIVATNIAQTSITIPDIDVVVDFGKEKRIEIVDGVEGIHLSDCSQADCLQRKGRAGRVKNGIYYLVGTPLKSRLEFAVPEIQRLRIESVILKFLAIGIDIEDIELFHKVDYEKIVDSKKVLEMLGAIKDGKITEIGKKMVKIPLDVRLSRMLIEAEKRGVLRDSITLASILQVGSYIKRDCSLPVKNYSSDAINMLLNFKMLEDEYFKTRDYTSYYFQSVNKKRYRDIIETRKKILEYYYKQGIYVTSTLNYEEVVKCMLVAYKDNVYVQEYYNSYVNEYRFSRILDRNSICHGSNILLGMPFDIPIKGVYRDSLRIINMCSKLSVEMLQEIAPEYINLKCSTSYYDGDKDTRVIYEDVYVHDKYVCEHKRYSNEGGSDLADFLVDVYRGYKSTSKEIEDFITRKDFYDSYEVRGYFLEVLDKYSISSLVDLTEKLSLLELRKAS